MIHFQEGRGRKSDRRGRDLDGGSNAAVRIRVYRDLPVFAAADFDAVDDVDALVLCRLEDEDVVDDLVVLVVIFILLLYSIIPNVVCMSYEVCRVHYW